MKSPSSPSGTNTFSSLLLLTTMLTLEGRGGEEGGEEGREEGMRVCEHVRVRVGVRVGGGCTWEVAGRV